MRVAMTVLASVVAVGAGSALPATVLVAPRGTVGPLKIDVSTRADVIAFAGHPEAERHDRYAGYAPYDALGYRCHGQRRTEACGTVFYLDTRSGTLAILDTEDARFETQQGIHVGTPTATAERLLHRVVHGGCDAYLFLRTRAAYLVLQFTGGPGKGKDRHVVGGHVGELVVHSSRHNPGVLDCIDSG
jgi:hypothetical protein